MKPLFRATLALLLVAFVPGPARAVPPAPYMWMEECTPITGSFDQRGVSSPAMLPIEVLIQPCRTPKYYEVFAVAFYRTGLAPVAYKVKFPLDGDVDTGGPVPGGSVAMCVIASEIDRLDCAQIDWQGSTANVGQHIAVNSPLVNVAAYPDWGPFGGGHPDCQNCFP